MSSFVSARSVPPSGPQSRPRPRPRSRGGAPTARTCVPPPLPVPEFEPIRAGGGGYRLRRSLRRRRRTIVAGLAMTAAALVLAVPHGTALPGRRSPVLVAAHDLPAGAGLRASDVTTARLPPRQVPAGAVTRLGEATGRTLAGPVRSGEPITDLRLLGPALLAGYGDGKRLVAAPVRIADAGTAALLRPGDRIDVLAGSGAGPPGVDVSGVDGADARAAPGAGGAARVVASGARVVAVPRPPRDGGGGAGTGGEGALVVLAVPRPVAARLAGAAAVSALAVTLG
jgi:pilus assembly protein CpaB